MIETDSSRTLEVRHDQQLPKPARKPDRVTPTPAHVRYATPVPTAIDGRLRDRWYRVYSDGDPFILVRGERHYLDPETRKRIETA